MGKGNSNLSGNGSNSKGKNQIHNKNKDRKPLVITVIVLVGVLLLGYNFISNGSKKTKDLSTNNNASNAVVSNNSSSSAAVLNSSDGIKISKKDITATAKFYPYDASGIKMEVLAVKAKDGTIRTALNTCQVCYSSGKGYYKQEGDELVCQNCGNRFKLNMVGSTNSGCNPVPVLDKNKTDDGTNIIISKDFLDKNKALFAKWKS